MTIATMNPPSVLAHRKSLMLRVHFWAALLASPFTLIAVLTGILYIFTPQIERSLYGHLEKVQPTGQRHSVDKIIANTPVPDGLILRSVEPAYAINDSVKLRFAAAHNQHADQHAGHHPAQAITVYVDPYRLTVLGELADDARFKEWATNLHSRLLQTDNWRWMIELAASWLLVMLLTGVYLWWPRGNSSGLPQTKAQGRNAWKQWHAFLGVACSVISIVIILTGITWSKYAGEQVRAMRDITGQNSPRMPHKLRSIPGETKLSWQDILERTRQQAPDVAVQLQAPRNAEGVWRVSAIDRSQPTKRFDLALDAYSGKTLYYSNWDELSAFGKATAVGIPFHRGEFGWWNQALLLVFGVVLLFSLISGWVMFFKRSADHPKQASLSLAFLPRLVPGAWRALPWSAYLFAGLLCLLMPLLAVSAALLLVLEIALGRRMAASS